MNANTPSSPAGKQAKGGTRPKNGFEDKDAEDGPWRHAPVAPIDAGIADSFGKAVSDVVTGPLDGADGKPKAR